METTPDDSYPSATWSCADGATPWRDLGPRVTRVLERVPAAGRGALHKRRHGHQLRRPIRVEAATQATTTAQ